MTMPTAPASKADKLRRRILLPVGRGAAFWPRLPAFLLVQLLTEFIRRDALWPYVCGHKKLAWHVARHAPVAYLANTKTASSSLVTTMLQDETGSASMDSLRQRRLRPDQRAHFKFTFVRDPFARLASFYMHKIVGERPAKIEHYLWGAALRLDLGFDVLARTVCQIPDALADRHFRSQHCKICPSGGEPQVDFVGRFESLPEQFEPIRQRYGLPALRRENASPDYDYRDLYTEELVERVATRYAGDIERFGYQDAHRELLRHVRRRPAAPAGRARSDAPAPKRPAAALSRADRFRRRVLLPVGRGAAFWPRLPALMLVQLLTELIRVNALSPRVRGHQRPLWHVASDAPVAYLVNPKTASRALLRAIHHDKAGSASVDSLHQHRLRPDQRARFRFTFVRDPFSRLASFYMDKVAGDRPDPDLKRYLWGALRADSGFDALARAVCQVPDALADRHFRSQHDMICPLGGPKVDFIGRFERLAEQFEPIRQRYGLPALGRMSAGPAYDYRDLYTEELVERVATRYAEDIERFGYQDARQELLRHVRRHRPAPGAPAR